MSTSALEAFAKRTDLVQFAHNGLAVFALQLRFGAQDAGEFADSITDGDGDKKCDIVHIDEETGTAVVVQAYVADDPTKVNPPLQKVTDLNTAASWLIDPTSSEAISPELASAAAQLKAAVEEGDLASIEFWFSHNLSDNSDVDRELSQVAATAKALLDKVYGDQAIGIDCRGVQVGRDALDQLYANRTQRILIEDLITVPTNDWFSESGDAWRAICTSVPGQWLRDLHETYGGDRLFSGNVREFLGRKRSDKNINYGIERTAETQPADFWAFNNGITALVSEILIDEWSEQLTLRGITIVNGAQTTGALASATAVDGVRVVARFVECTDNELVESIIRANNTQNEIRSSDFRSNDEHQKRLRSQFDAIPGAHYSGARRGEYISSVAGSEDLISADQAAQALAAFHGEPQRAYHGKSKIWEDATLYNRFFSHTSAEHIVYVVALQRAIATLKRTLRDNPDRTAADGEILAFLSQRGAPFLLMAAIGYCHELIIESGAADSYKLSFGTLVSPAVAEELWTPVVESLIAFHPALDDAAQSGRIRSEDVRTDALSSFRANVYALKAPLTTAVFTPFRAHVVAE